MKSLRQIGIYTRLSSVSLPPPVSSPQGGRIILDTAASAVNRIGMDNKIVLYCRVV